MLTRISYYKLGRGGLKHRLKAKGLVPVKHGFNRLQNRICFEQRYNVYVLGDG